jgi:hypothetical protein
MNKMSFDDMLSNYSATVIQIMQLKHKLSSDYRQHSRELDYLVETIQESSARELINKYHEKISEDFFSEYSE